MLHLYDLTKEATTRFFKLDDFNFLSGQTFGLFDAIYLFASHRVDNWEHLWTFLSLNSTKFQQVYCAFALRHIFTTKHEPNANFIYLKSFIFSSNHGKAAGYFHYDACLLQQSFHNSRSLCHGSQINDLVSFPFIARTTTFNFSAFFITLSPAYVIEVHCWIALKFGSNWRLKNRAFRLCTRFKAVALCTMGLILGSRISWRHGLGLRSQGCLLTFHLGFRIKICYIFEVTNANQK